VLIHRSGDRQRLLERHPCQRRQEGVEFG
jgi:hypothetical protein